MINWNNISPTEFEKLCYRILELCKFTNIEWQGASGNDLGRDLTANKIENPLPNITEVQKWVIQCKRYTKKSVSIEDINGFLIRCKQFNFDSALFVVTKQLTSSTRDWLESVKSDYKFKIYIWEKTEIESLVRTYYSDLKHEFPNIIDEKETVKLYGIDTGKYIFSTNEFEEVDISAFNCNNSEEAKMKINEFLEFIRDNDFIIE
jgi:hypothetical protein